VEPSRPPSAAGTVGQNTRQEAESTRTIESAQSPVGTGIKERILILAMNTNGNLPYDFHHHFYLLNSTRLNNQRVALYEDKHSSMKLMTAGPIDDLALIQLQISLKDFIDEKQGKVTADGAAAFGRCVQRMAFAADPNWYEDLYNWMNQQMARAMLTPEGASTRRRNLSANFATFKTEGDQMIVAMTIGTFDGHE
jgi:hypothetical protein